jgi:hypothetical protein
MKDIIEILGPCGIVAIILAIGISAEMIIKARKG